MPLENPALNEAIDNALADDITVYLNKGNPGSNGTAGRVTALTTASVTLATANWTINATSGHAEVTADIDFGNATAAINGVNWYSLFKGNVFWARRALAASKDIANGAPVTLTGSTVEIEFTSVDA